MTESSNSNVSVEIKASPSNSLGWKTMLAVGSGVIALSGFWWANSSYQSDLKNRADRRKEKKATKAAREIEGLTKEELAAYLDDIEKGKKESIKACEEMVKKLQVQYGRNRVPMPQLQKALQVKFAKDMEATRKKSMKKYKASKKMLFNAKKKYKDDPLIKEKIAQQKKTVKEQKPSTQEKKKEGGIKIVELKDSKDQKKESIDDKNPAKEQKSEEPKIVELKESKDQKKESVDNKNLPTEKESEEPKIVELKESNDQKKEFVGKQSPAKEQKPENPNIMGLKESKDQKREAEDQKKE